LAQNHYFSAAPGFAAIVSVRSRGNRMNKPVLARDVVPFPGSSLVGEAIAAADMSDKYAHLAPGHVTAHADRGTFWSSPEGKGETPPAEAT
jgi:hypothetical protein